MWKVMKINEGGGSYGKGFLDQTTELKKALKLDIQNVNLASFIPRPTSCY